MSTVCFLGDTLSGCVTQDPKVGSLGTCAIHPTHLWISRILLSVWFTWSLVFVSRPGAGICYIILLVLGWGGVGRKHN